LPDGADAVRWNAKHLRESIGEGFDTVKTFVSWELDQKFEIGKSIAR